MPDPKFRSNYVGLRMTISELEPLRRFAKARGVSQSEAIRFLLFKGLRSDGDLTTRI